MTELLKSNFSNLKDVLGIDLVIDFKKKYFNVENCNKIIFRDKILNYDASFDSQKMFILNVLKKLFKFVRDDETIEYNKIDVNGLYENIVGREKFIFENRKIELDKKRFRRCKAWLYDLSDYYGYNDCLYDLLDIIEDNIDREKIRIVFEDRYRYGGNDYLIVDRAIKEYIVKINDKKVSLYCSNVTNREIRKAVGFIKNVIFTNRTN